MLRKAALLVSLSTAHSARIATRATPPIMAINDFKATKLDGAEVNLADITNGKPTLVLNVASL